MSEFKDHYSKQSKPYSKHRPEYPPSFYKYLASLCEEHELAWDCATGNGQAARGLCAFFNDVCATDASAQQILNASGPDNIEFKVANAAFSGLADQSVDIITVAQALHWFDLDKFYTEVRRVSKPNGILAVWCYGLMKIDDQIDPLFLEFYNDVVGSYWPSERRHIENGYAELSFPLKKQNCPDFHLDIKWSLDEFLGYLRTWSATTRFIEDNDFDPVSSWENKFKTAWGSETEKTIHWPLTVLIGFVAQDALEISIDVIMTPMVRPSL